jgi:hypothetical protein
VQLFYLARIMGTSVQQIDQVYGHLLPDSEDYREGCSMATTRNSRERPHNRSISFTDWIGLLQTVVLAVTAWVAFSGLRLTTKENSLQRAEWRRQPRRELLLDAVRELKELAAQVEVLVPGTGHFDTSVVAARKHRLRVALDFFPETELPRTRAAADEHDLTQATVRGAIAPAAGELAAELHRLQETYTD